MNDAILHYTAARFGFRIEMQRGFGYVASCGCGSRRQFALGNNPVRARWLLLDVAADLGRGAQA